MHAPLVRTLLVPSNWQNSASNSSSDRCGTNPRQQSSVLADSLGGGAGPTWWTILQAKGPHRQIPSDKIQVWRQLLAVAEPIESS